MPKIILRPHHGLCIAHFVGKGYDDAFVENMTDVIRRLNEPDAAVRLTSSPDVICARCPNNQGGACRSGQKVALYDAKALALCGLAEGQTLPWAAYARAVWENILSQGRLITVCDGCCWLDICTSFYPKEDTQPV